MATTAPAPATTCCASRSADLQRLASRSADTQFETAGQSESAGITSGRTLIQCACRNAQALSKRIHYGKFVAEAKFRSQTAKYAELIERQDAEGIMDALTDRLVELKVGFGVLLQA